MAAALELPLVVAGAWLSWRAAERLTRNPDVAARRRARLVAGAPLAGGAVVRGLALFVG